MVDPSDVSYQISKMTSKVTLSKFVEFMALIAQSHLSVQLSIPFSADAALPNRKGSAIKLLKDSSVGYCVTPAYSRSSIVQL